MSLVIKNNLTSVIEVKKSKFYTYIFKVDDDKKVDAMIKDIRNEHPDLRHLLYCYKIGTKVEASEDKEPISSMHKCLANLEKKRLDKILCVVVRYFGGVLLGAGNLDRTYSSCIFDLLKDENLEEDLVKLTYKGVVKTSFYSYVIKELEKDNATIIDKNFLGDKVEITFQIVVLKDEIKSYFSSLEEI